ncbi:RepB family plasmid replication initiator protein [Helicobacter ailurogastricus]|uniref:RepB family plasmid replication initiator protein n=1 Tax=Helicobacter ailurogastricus TaxID=1578720 RepID=UPI0032DB72EB
MTAEQKLIKSCSLGVLPLKLINKKNIEYLYFTYLLNDLRANFTQMKLQTFIDLSGEYTKNLFGLLERLKTMLKTAFFKRSGGEGDSICMKTIWRVFVLLWACQKALE